LHGNLESLVGLFAVRFCASSRPMPAHARPAQVDALQNGDHRRDLLAQGIAEYVDRELSSQ